MSLKFKNYTWPNDPDTYQEILSRDILLQVLRNKLCKPVCTFLRRQLGIRGAFFYEI